MIDKKSSGIEYYIPLLLLPIANIIESIMIKSEMLASSGAENLLSALVWVCGEEIVFRKALPTFFERYTNIEVKRRCIMEAAIFSLAHLLNLIGGGNVREIMVQMIVAFGVGYAFAVLVKVDKNIIPCILVHFLLNSTGRADETVSSPVFWDIIWCALAFTCILYGSWIFRKEVRQKTE